MLHQVAKTLLKMEFNWLYFRDLKVRQEIPVHQGDQDNW